MNNVNDLEFIYLLYGDELYMKDIEIKRIKKVFGKIENGINYIMLDNTNVNQLKENIETPPFGYEKKLIIIKDSGLFIKNAKKKVSNSNNNDQSSNIAEYINDNIEAIKETNIIVFIEETVEKNKLFQVIEKEGKVINFEQLKPIELTRKIKSICNAYKVHIDDNVCSYFVESTGQDMQTLINEIRKQIEYVGENGIITKEAIDDLGVKDFNSKIFDLTDSLGNRNIKKSLDSLNNLLYEKEPIQKILITLYNIFKKIYFTKIAIKENKKIEEALDLKPNQLFLIKKYMTQSKLFKEEELRNILQEFINLDYKTKIGEIDINVGLESIMCRYCS